MSKSHETAEQHIQSIRRATRSKEPRCTARHADPLWADHDKKALNNLEPTVAQDRFRGCQFLSGRRANVWIGHNGFALNRWTPRMWCGERQEVSNDEAKAIQTLQCGVQARGDPQGDGRRDHG